MVCGKQIVAVCAVCIVTAVQNVVELLGKGADPFIHLLHVIRNALIINAFPHRCGHAHSVVCQISVIQGLIGNHKGVGIRRLTACIVAAGIGPGIIIKYLIS